VEWSSGGGSDGSDDDGSGGGGAGGRSRSVPLRDPQGIGRGTVGGRGMRAGERATRWGPARPTVGGGDVGGLHS